MGQRAATARQGGDQSPAQKSAPKSNGATELIEFMEKRYDKYFANVKSFDEFYHAIFELIELFCEERGQMQYKIPEKSELEKAYKESRRTTGALTRDEFVNISQKVIKFNSFTFGKAAIDVLMFLFGAPMCALFVKRIVPGLKSISDDVVIPLATSASVVYLAKTNKL